MNLPHSSRSERSQASILLILAALVLCISNMLALQVHRDIGHTDHIVSRYAEQFAHQSGPPTVLVNRCQLCDLGFPPDSAPSLPFRLIMDRTPVRVRHDDVSPRFLTIASTGHIWRSRAPPAFLTHMA